MDRRAFLTLLAAGTAVALAGCDALSQTNPVPGTPKPDPALPPPPPKSARLPVPIGASITDFPGEGRSMALTIDDGTDPDVIAGYTEFCKRTGARITFFITSIYPGWRTHAEAIRPLVESGQIQLANHTYDHPYLTKISKSEIATQLSRCKEFMQNTYGVDGTPYYRPPFGAYNDTVTAVAADLGYTVQALWDGDISDHLILTPEQIIENARKYFREQTIVIGHANHPGVLGAYDGMADIVRERNLSMVTLDDIFGPAT